MGSKSMNRHLWKNAGAAVFLVVISIPIPSHADFEVTGPDNRRILLKDDGTWRHVDGGGGKQADDKAKEAGEAVLNLVEKTGVGKRCRFVMQLVNNLPYEIRTIVPSFIAYRANDVVYNSISSNFNDLLPGNSQKRKIEFEGISCSDITRLQVAGAKRCTMGELTRYSPEEGQCLARIRVVESDLVRFEK